MSAGRFAGRTDSQTGLCPIPLSKRPLNRPGRFARRPTGGSAGEQTVQNRYNLDLDDEKALDFDNILKKAYIFIESRGQMVELATTDIKNDKMSNLVDKFAKKSYLKQLFSSLFALSDLVFQVPVIPSAPVVTTSPSQNDKKIEDLIDMMQTLALSINTLQSNTSATLIISQPEHPSANALPKPRMQTNS